MKGCVAKALVLAAGEGTRLRPLTADRPKALVEINGIPLLEHLLALLHCHGVREVAINVHYRAQEIVRFAGDGRAWGLRISYLEEKTLLGSGGTVRALRTFLSEPFFLIYGDVLTNLDLSYLARRHTEGGGVLTCLLHRVPDPWNKGVAELDNEGRIVHFAEKPLQGTGPSDLAAAGIYVAEPAIIAAIPEETPCDFGATVVPAVLARGMRVVGEELIPEIYLRDIGTLEEYARAQQDAALGRVRVLRRPVMLAGAMEDEMQV